MASSFERRVEVGGGLLFQFVQPYYWQTQPTVDKAALLIDPNFTRTAPLAAWHRHVKNCCKKACATLKRSKINIFVTPSILKPDSFDWLHAFEETNPDVFRIIGSARNKSREMPFINLEWLFELNITMDKVQKDFGLDSIWVFETPIFKDMEIQNCHARFYVRKDRKPTMIGPNAAYAKFLKEDCVSMNIEIPALSIISQGQLDRESEAALFI